ncbi:hypothetical protein FGO68_gene9745 [Halteria grandinella]|uniref:Uncharacterized protein n=1 Tax=Halteria grandinella TaxID=5974 RepID=A0A8J8NJT3_HALGN|nr:hypothetical protein FGO68_gene9745 [Halteria grandinella]
MPAALEMMYPMLQVAMMRQIISKCNALPAKCISVTVTLSHTVNRILLCASLISSGLLCKSTMSELRQFAVMRFLTTIYHWRNWNISMAKESTKTPIIEAPYTDSEVIQALQSKKYSRQLLVMCICGSSLGYSISPSDGFQCTPCAAEQF